MRIASLVVCLVVLFNSCEKNDVDETGFIEMKVVNASPVSMSQSFSLAGTSLISGGLEFTDASDYIQTVSGTRLVAEFRNEGSSSTYARGELWTRSGERYTVFLAGGNGDERVKMYEDNLSRPDNGRSRVRFIHLSDDAPSVIRIRDGNGEDLVRTLSIDIASGYVSVVPGTLSLRVSGVASGSNVGNFDIPNIEAGKIYTVYLTGVSSTGTTAHLMVHN